MATVEELQEQITALEREIDTINQHINAIETALVDIDAWKTMTSENKKELQKQDERITTIEDREYNKKIESLDSRLTTTENNLANNNYRFATTEDLEALEQKVGGGVQASLNGTTLILKIPKEE